MAGIGAMVNGEASPASNDAAPEDGEQPNVTPEEQAAYEQLIRNAFKVIYPEGGEDAISPQVLKGLSANPENPVLALGSTAATLVSGLRDSAKKVGQPVPDEILYHGGQRIVEELAEVAEAKKIHDYSEEEIEQAWYAGLDLYRTMSEQSGDFDKEGASQGWNELVAADQQGRAGDMLPGVNLQNGPASPSEEAE